jgi:hypothetical protein
MQTLAPFAIFGPDLNNEMTMPLSLAEHEADFLRRLREIGLHGKGPPWCAASMFRGASPR